jgi:hypothetical protein
MKRGDQEITLRIRSRGNPASIDHHVVERFVDTLDIDVRPYTRLTGNGQVCDEVTDDVPRAVLEARLVPIAVHTPPEDTRIKRG